MLGIGFFWLVEFEQWDLGQGYWQICGFGCMWMRCCLYFGLGFEVNFKTGSYVGEYRLVIFIFIPVLTFFSWGRDRRYWQSILQRMCIYYHYPKPFLVTWVLMSMYSTIPLPSFLPKPHARHVSHFLHHCNHLVVTTREQISGVLLILNP